MRAADAIDQRRHVGVGLDDIRKHGNQLEAVIGDLAAIDLEVEAGQELAVRSGRHQQGVFHFDGGGNGVVGMSGQDDVDAGDAGGQFAVDVEAVVAVDDDEIDAGVARFVDPVLELLLFDAERPVRHHVPRVGDRRVGEGLADNRDAHAAPFEDLGVLENVVVPGGVLDVAGEEGEVEHLDQFLDALGAVGEFPMGRHGVDAQCVHHLDHVLAPRFQRGVGALPGITAVEQQGVVGPLCPDRLDQRRHAVHAADAPAIPGQRRVIVRGHGIGGRAAAAQTEMFEKILARQMWRQAVGVADPDIDRWFAEIKRYKLGVAVGEIKQRDLAQRIKFQKLVLRQLAAGGGQVAGRARHHGGGRGNLEKITTGQHAEPLEKPELEIKWGMRMPHIPHQVIAVAG